MTAHACKPGKTRSNTSFSVIEAKWVCTPYYTIATAARTNAGRLAPMTLPDGRQTTLLPMTFEGARLPLRMNPPRLGQHTDRLLELLAYSRADIDVLLSSGVIGSS